MKTTVDRLRELIREQFSTKLEDLDRERRKKAGYDESDGEMDYKDLPEDVDRLNRAADGYGETEFEEEHCPSLNDEPELETNLYPSMDKVAGKEDMDHAPELEALSLMDAAEKMTPEKAQKILRHGHVHGKTLSKDQKALFQMLAAGGSEPKAKKEKE